MYLDVFIKTGYSIDNFILPIFTARYSAFEVKLIRARDIPKIAVPKNTKATVYRQLLYKQQPGYYFIIFLSGTQKVRPPRYLARQ